MKRTELQKKVMSLSKTLPTIDDEYFWDMYGDLEVEILDWYSYNSHAYFGGKMHSGYRDMYDNVKYLRIVTATEEFIVDRWFEVKVHKRSLNAMPKGSFKEVMQKWENRKGEVVVLKKININDLGEYFIWWNNRTRLIPREDNMIIYNNNEVSQYEDDFFRYATDTLPREYQEVYAIVNDADILNRMYSNDSINANYAETLLKTNHRDMFDYYINRPYRVNEFYNSIMVAYRHGYQFADKDKWFKYMHLMSRQGKDLLNPYYICPTDLDKSLAHAERVQERIDEENRRLAEIERKERQRREMLKRAEEHDSYAIEMAKYLGITFKSSDGSIEFKVLQTPEEFIAEGKHMHNCVGDYWMRRHRNSVVMVAIDVKTGNHLANIEISLTDYRIVQCYAKYNEESEYDRKLRNAVKKNISLFKLAA